MSRRTWQPILVVVVALAACALLAAPASAAALHAPPAAGLFDFLNPIKDIAELVTKVVGKLFGALASVLMPDFLKKASIETLKGLVAMPNLSNARQWHNVGQLRSGTTAIAWALLPLPFTLATLRYLIGTFTDGPHPIMSVVRLVGAAAGLVVYPWAAGQVFALVNVLTDALLSMPAVGNGLQRAVGVLFGAAIIAGIASPFLACLALVAIVMGTLLFGLKIAIVMIAALLYVAGPLMIALSTLQETSHLYRAWLFAFIALAFIPIGWCLIFAVAGALTLDATSGGISAGLLSKDTTSALAALLAFGLAVLWPKVLIGHALQVASGMGIGLRGVGGGQGRGTVPSPARAQSAVRNLRDGSLTVGRGVGRAMGHLGAPAGGAAGWAGRVMGRTAPVAAAAGAAGTAAGALGGQVARIRARAADGSGGRITRAAAELADIPGALRSRRGGADGATPAPDAETPAGAAAGGAARSPGERPAPPRRERGGSQEAAPPPEAARPRRRRPLSPEKRAVLSRLPRDVPPRVREAVIRARPGHAAQAATRAAQRADAPLAASTRRAVFAAAAGASKTPTENPRSARPTAAAGKVAGATPTAAQPEPARPGPRKAASAAHGSSAPQSPTARPAGRRARPAPADPRKPRSAPEAPQSPARRRRKPRGLR